MLRRFFAYYRPYRGLFILDFSCAVLSGVLELGFPMAVKAFVDVLLPGGEWAIILAASVGLLLIYVLNTGLMRQSPIGDTCSASISRPICAGSLSITAKALFPLFR